MLRHFSIRKGDKNFKFNFSQSQSALLIAVVSVLQRRLKMDQRRIRRFFGFWKWTKDKYEESWLIQKFFEDLQRYKDQKVKII